VPLAIIAASAASGYSFDEGQAFLKKYCQSCHQAGSGAGGFHLRAVDSTASLLGEPQKWHSLANRVRNGEMPPKGAPAPDLDEREHFTKWVSDTLRTKACASAPAAGPSRIRRLNRDEYTATIRDLLDIHMDIGQALPLDGAGGEGFDNAAETLFLSPLHSEKYMEMAKFAVDFAAKEFKSRAKVMVARPGPSKTPDQAAREILANFLPRAFRRPVADSEISPYLALFQTARKQGQPFEQAVWFAIRGALVSPLFLFRAEPPNNTPEARPLDQFALASRLSYFLWGSMPDELLTDIASEGRLQNPEVLRRLAAIMLRNDKSLEFAERFVEQWLHTRELTGDKAPDPKLFPTYAGDEELRSDIRFQPILFFRELLLRNMSLLNLLDSRYTIGTSNLSKHFGMKLALKQTGTKQPQWVELPEGSHRGGLLGMPAIMAVSSYPYRTSPVLRGAFILDAILGTPPPPPPPNVPALEETKDGAPPKSTRERLAQHRAAAACAGCHSRIDPLGFALENYDVIGRWRDQEGGKPVDNSGELIDGTKFQGPDELKKALLDRKDLFIRNLTSKMLGYALGRGLTLQDSCAVDQIAAQLRDNDYSAQTLIEGIVLSAPFRNQAGAAPAAIHSRKEQQKQ
jgi:mono/diheme cytochrome c family protein